MKNDRAIRKIGTRLLVASPLFILGWYLVDTGSGRLFQSLQILFGMACFVAAAVIVGPSIAGLLAQPSARLYETPGISGRPASRSIYGVAEIRRSQGRYQEAMVEYEKISERYPLEVKPYADMIDIAALDFGDRVRALAVFRKGIAVLEKEDDRERLRAMLRASLGEMKKRE